jgi:hypothetical protein
MLGCKAIDNPVEENVKLGENSEIPLVDIDRDNIPSPSSLQSGECLVECLL